MKRKIFTIPNSKTDGSRRGRATLAQWSSGMSITAIRSVRLTSSTPILVITVSTQGTIFNRQTGARRPDTDGVRKGRVGLLEEVIREGRDAQLLDLCDPASHCIRGKEAFVEPRRIRSGEVTLSKSGDLKVDAFF